MRRPGFGRSSITVVAVSRVGLKAAVNERRTTWPTSPHRRTTAAELHVLGVDLVQEVRLARIARGRPRRQPPTQPVRSTGAAGWGLGAGRARKLEADPAHPQHLLTEPGMGYRFVST